MIFLLFPFLACNCGDQGEQKTNQPHARAMIHRKQKQHAAHRKKGSDGMHALFPGKKGKKRSGKGQGDIQMQEIEKRAGFPGDFSAKEADPLQKQGNDHQQAKPQAGPLSGAH